MHAHHRGRHRPAVPYLGGLGRRDRQPMLTAFALAAVVALLVAVLGCGSSQPGTAPTAHTTTSADGSVLIAALEQPARPRDAMPAKLRRQDIMSESLDFDSARRIARVSDPAWLVRSAEGRAVCVARSAALNCSYVSELRQRGFGPGLSFHPPGPVRVSGIATDAVTQVDVVMRDGSVQTEQIRDNVLALDLPDYPQEVRWQGPHGTETMGIPPNLSRIPKPGERERNRHRDDALPR